MSNTVPIFCCSLLQKYTFVSTELTTVYDKYKCLVFYSHEDGAFGMKFPYKSEYVKLVYCPWCGKSLEK